MTKSFKLLLATVMITVALVSTQVGIALDSSTPSEAPFNISTPSE
ncbi:hypothetical protein [Mechercharimyces sp. CAU 1602]|nr:hypothetical protein [Mechercharimyces sp. CAU 1602]MCS1350420.1 hypothetical protein [Mechercharimyces sp. CAU 1602]